MTAAQILAVLGAVFELIGFSWVIADASAALSHEYGEHGPFRRVWYWVRYWIGPPGRSSSVSAATSASFGMSGRLTATKAGETDIERLDRELGELRTDLEEHKTQTEQRMSDIDNRLRETAERLTERADEIEKRMSESRRTALRRERRGARVFMFGILLTLISALI